jgi:acylphosphatase
MPCLRLIISGRVQGVWFRESMRQEALKLGASGWVRNLTDGRVEAMVCGDPISINQLLDWTRKGPPLAKVARVESEESLGDCFSGFEKR